MIATCEKCCGPFPVADRAKTCPVFCPRCGRAYAADARAKLEAGDGLAREDEVANDRLPNNRQGT